jgi:hypothetical protein
MKKANITSHPLYPTWVGMKARCYSANSTSYKRYGARGITVCARWLNDFQSFADDIGPKPDGEQIDRIDNDLGYSPENCRWADRSLQSKNRRPWGKTVWNGEKTTIAKLAKERGFSKALLASRIKRWGDLELALTMPIGWRMPERTGPRAVPR